MATYNPDGGNLINVKDPDTEIGDVYSPFIFSGETTSVIYTVPSNKYIVIDLKSVQVGFASTGSFTTDITVTLNIVPPSDQTPHTLFSRIFTGLTFPNLGSFFSLTDQDGMVTVASGYKLRLTASSTGGAVNLFDISLNGTLLEYQLPT